MTPLWRRALDAIELPLGTASDDLQPGGNAVARQALRTRRFAAMVCRLGDAPNVTGALWRLS